MVMARQDDINLQFVKEGHETASGVGQFVLRRQIGFDDILVHEDDLPWLSAGEGIAAQPVPLFGEKPGAHGLQFLPLGIEDDEMHWAVIEGEVGAGEPAAAVVWNTGKIMEEGFWPAYFPVSVVSFMIAKDRNQRRSRRDMFHGCEPVVPLGAVFAVIHQVPQLPDRKSVV